ncbi:hypothetical protein JCM16303_004569 [Sporobolomyces ruberrimus]
MRLIGVYLHLCLLLHLAQAQHQLAFGIHTGQNLRQKEDAPARQPPPSPPPPHSSSPSSTPDTSNLSPKDLHHFALSLSESLTSHSTLSQSTRQTTYLPPSISSSTEISSSSSLLDSLERSLGSSDSLPVKTLQRGRSFVSRLYAGGGGNRKAQGKLDWSVRGFVLGLKSVVEKFTKEATLKDVLKVATTGRGGAGRGVGGGSDPKRWREKLGGFGSGVGGGLLNEEETREGMEEVVRLLNRAGERGSGESLTLLGDLYLTGHLTLPVNTTASTEYYTLASEKHGNPEAQYKLGYLYGTNYGDAFGSGIKSRQGSALLHYTFSALSGHVPASMTVGYRHWAGIGTKQSCQDALPWYKSAAEAAIRTYNAGPPGGLHLPPPKLRLSDLSGGVYGPGSGSSKPPTLSTGGSTAQSMQEWQDLIEFHQFHAEKGDSVYMFRLARLFYGGFGAGGLGGSRTRGSKLSVTEKNRGVVNDGLWDGGRDFGRSSRWFVRLARKVWSGDGKEAMWDPNKLGPFNSNQRGSGGGGSNDARSSPVPNSPLKKSKDGKEGGDSRLGYYDPKLDKKNEKVDDQTTMVAGLAAGYLGRMFLRGEGVNVNFAKAFLWFKRGTTRGDRESHNGLGVMYRDGLGVDRNLKTAIMHFHAAAQQDLAEAQVNLGKYHFGMGETVLATTFFEAAIRTDGIRQPDTFQSYYYLAELSSLASASIGDNCPVTVSFYKHVAERGDWDHEVWFEAERAREKGDLRKALLGYWIMAERGYEVAQNNVAWILDRDKSRIQVPLLDSEPIGSNETDRIALTYWTRSAAQDNVDALVKLGDYYFKGIGTGLTSEDELEEGGNEVTGGPQYEKAATFYQSAATSRLSAMAMWNLGWMHETGQGVPQDFHLAKRYLDSALETSPNAYFPSKLSLISLYARALYHVVFSPSDEMNALSLFGRDPVDPLAEEQAANGFVPQGGWGFGRAWRDIQRSWGIDPGPEPEVIPLRQPPTNGGGNGQAPAGNGGADERGLGQDGREPWEYAQEDVKVRQQQQRRVGEDEDDEFFIDDEGDFAGTVAIIALCMLLAWLVYFRQRPQDNRENPHQARAAAPPAPGQRPLPPHEDRPRPTPTVDAAREDDRDEHRLV